MAVVLLIIHFHDCFVALSDTNMTAVTHLDIKGLAIDEGSEQNFDDACINIKKEEELGRSSECAENSERGLGIWRKSCVKKNEMGASLTVTPNTTLTTSSVALQRNGDRCCRCSLVSG
ncbi:uncharacterized protein HKW66_Vig0245930 [Vigna angularis]|uniref:Peroxidase n=1 Tax=Phaseolus angularis TaxID=3914 RepID=A0A8T0KBT4_PHAAN|nr:uncharacterized protein HKW66_Vig0245930 [Vigna angularis]